MMLAFHAPPGRRDHACDEKGKDARQDHGLPPLNGREPEQRGHLAQVGRNRHRAGDHVEQDVPLRPQQHQGDRTDAHASTRTNQRKQ